MHICWYVLTLSVAKTDNVAFVAGKQFSTPFTVSLADSSSEFTVRYSIIPSTVRSGATVSQLGTEVTVYANGNDSEYYSLWF